MQYYVLYQFPPVFDASCPTLLLSSELDRIYCPKLLGRSHGKQDTCGSSILTYHILHIYNVYSVSNFIFAFRRWLERQHACVHMQSPYPNLNAG
jgi:hypothetical protein